VLDLRATANNIPLKLVAVIYNTILGMRKPALPQVIGIISCDMMRDFNNIFLLKLETHEEDVDIVQIPLHQLVCPLSHQLFDDPVTTVHMKEKKSKNGFPSMTPTQSPTIVSIRKN
jgi:hypothetical protein